MTNAEINLNRWLLSNKVSEADKEIINNMNGVEKDDAFYCDIAFGTAGMRGRLGPGTNRLNLFTVAKATVAFGLYLLEQFPMAASMGVAISHDNRHFSREFTLEASRILNDMGIKTYIFDSLRPTPELSYAVRYAKCCGGIMITASHNPKEDNGYKVYDEKGCQLVPSKIDIMLDIWNTLPSEIEVEVPVSKKKGETIVFDSKIDDDYVKEVEAIQINPQLDKKGFKIVYSPQHGTSYENAMRVFEELGYEVYPVESQCIHDPDFSATASPNPENPSSYEESIKLAEKIGADLIVMTDPDGDRCGLAFRNSRNEFHLLSGNQSGALLIEYILSERKKRGDLPANGLFCDTIVTSSLGAEIAASYGLKVESYLTGFKYIGEAVGKYEEIHGAPTYVFGYEESYGCLPVPFVRDKDGIQAILLYSEMALFHHLNGETLGDALTRIQQAYGFHDAASTSKFFKGSKGAMQMKELMNTLRFKGPSEIAGIKVVGMADYLRLEETRNGVVSKIDLPPSDVIKYFLEDRSTVAVRPSGTEPKVKFYIESVSSVREGLKEKSDAIKESLFNFLGL